MRAVTPNGARTSPRRERERVPILIPLTAAALLAALWLLSAYNGWAVSAFCTDRGLGSDCSQHIANAVGPSTAIAILAAGFAVAAGLAPWVIRPESPGRGLRIWLLALSVAAWLLALLILFAVGETTGA